MVWQSFVRNWIQQQATSKLAEHLREQPGPSPPNEPESMHCDVGLVFALGIECGGLADLLSTLRTTRTRGCVVRRGTLSGRNVTIVEAGVGREAAIRGTEILIAGHQPAWIISAGFSGGVDPRLKRGDIVMADEIVDSAGHRLRVDLRVDPQALAATPGVHVGRLLTVDRIIASADEKRRLGREHGALAIDMESWSVAEACRVAQARFLCVRVVSDPVDEALPPEVLNLVNQKTTASRLGAATSALWQRPGSIKDMWRLKENALMCTDRLAAFLAEVTAQLPPSAASAREPAPGGPPTSND